MDFKSQVLANAQEAKRLLDTAKELGILDSVAEYFRKKEQANEVLVIPAIYNKYLHYLKHKNIFKNKQSFLQKLVQVQQVHGIYVISLESLKKDYRTIVMKVVTADDWKQAFGESFFDKKEILLFGRRFDNGGIATLYTTNANWLNNKSTLVILTEGLATLNVSGVKNEQEWLAALEQKLMLIPGLREQLTSLSEDVRRQYIHLIVQNLMVYRRVDNEQGIAQTTTFFGERDNLKLSEVGDMIKAYDAREDYAGLLVLLLESYSKQYNQDVLRAIQEIIEVGQLQALRKQAIKELVPYELPDKFVAEKAKMPAEKIKEILKKKYGFSDDAIEQIDTVMLAANFMRYQQEVSRTFNVNLQTVEDIFATVNVCKAKLSDLIQADLNAGKMPAFLKNFYDSILNEISKKGNVYLAYFIIVNFVPIFWQKVQSGSQKDLLAIFLATQRFQPLNS